MKANYKRLTKEDHIKVYREQANNIAQSTIAAVLLVMYKRGRTKKYVQDLYQEILWVLEQPQVFGKQMTDIDVMNFITEKYDIDFSRVHLLLETEAEIRIRERKEREKNG